VHCRGKISASSENAVTASAQAAPKPGRERARFARVAANDNCAATRGAFWPRAGWNGNADATVKVDAITHAGSSATTISAAGIEAAYADIKTMTVPSLAF